MEKLQSRPSFLLTLHILLTFFSRPVDGRTEDGMPSSPLYNRPRFAPAGPRLAAYWDAPVSTAMTSKGESRDGKK